MIDSLSQIVETAKELGPARIAVAVANEPDVLAGLQLAETSGLAIPILIGNPDRIRSVAKSVGYTLSRASIVEAHNEEEAIRKAIDLVRSGEADLLMKGKVTTSSLIHGVLDRATGIRANSLLSQVIVFELPTSTRLMLLSDAAINIAPSLEQKADICRNAIKVARALGIENPRLALLAALEFVTSAMPATVDAAALTIMNRRGQIQDAYLEGPIALDVPLSSFAADRKSIKSPLVENTDVFILPNIEAANILFRAILYLAQGQSAGIVVGAQVPLVLLSRAETPETKVRSIALARLVQMFDHDSSTIGAASDATSRASYA